MSQPHDDFETLAAQEPERGILRDFWDFLKSNKKWWLVPLLLALALLGLLIALAASPLAPIIYPFA